MAMFINNPDLEKRLEEAGGRLPMPVKKTTVLAAVAIAAMEIVEAEKIGIDVLLNELNLRASKKKRVA